MQKSHRVIFHIDMNCYFASVEMVHRPELKGKAVAIAGNVKERKGIIITCSYEAREAGVRTTMPLWEGLKRCPDLIVLPQNHALYRKTAYEVFHLLGHFSPLLEPASIDEAYLDVTNMDETYKNPIDLAKKIQETLLEKMGLPCSIGIAPNKFLAKMASDMKKPLGITILRKRDVPNVLWHLPVEEMHGIGRRTKEKYHALGIYTIEDLAKADLNVLAMQIGKVGRIMHERANGIDLRPVNPNSILSVKTIGNSTTLPENSAKEEVLLEVFHQLCEKVSGRLKNKRVVATTIQITIRYGDRKTVTRSQTLMNPMQETEELFRLSVDLFRKHWTGNSVRLLGVSALETMDEKDRFKQLDLFSYEKEIPGKKELSELASHLNEKLGKDSLFLGSKLKKQPVVKTADEQLYEQLKQLEDKQKKL